MSDCVQMISTYKQDRSFITHSWLTTPWMPTIKPGAVRHHEVCVKSRDGSGAAEDAADIWLWH